MIGIIVNLVSSNRICRFQVHQKDLLEKIGNHIKLFSRYKNYVCEPEVYTRNLEENSLNFPAITSICHPTIFTKDEVIHFAMFKQKQLTDGQYSAILTELFSFI